MTPEEAQPETIEEMLRLLTGALTRAGIPFAVGRALAAGAWSEPRATQAIGLDIFLSEDRAGEVLDALIAIGIAVDLSEHLAVIEQAGQVRLPWGPIFVDLFFSYHEFHDTVASGTVPVEVRGIVAPVLSAEDITVFKTLFNRPQDWIDIEKIIATQGERFDGDYALDWAGRILGTDDEAYLRLAGLICECRENPV